MVTTSIQSHLSKILFLRRLGISSSLQYNITRLIKERTKYHLGRSRLNGFVRRHRSAFFPLCASHFRSPHWRPTLSSSFVYTFWHDSNRLLILCNYYIIVFLLFTIEVTHGGRLYASTSWRLFTCHNPGKIPPKRAGSLVLYLPIIMLQN